MLKPRSYFSASFLITRCRPTSKAGSILNHMAILLTSRVTFWPMLNTSIWGLYHCLSSSRPPPRQRPCQLTPACKISILTFQGIVFQAVSFSKQHRASRGIPSTGGVFKSLGYTTAFRAEGLGTCPIGSRCCGGSNLSRAGSHLSACLHVSSLVRAEASRQDGSPHTHARTNVLMERPASASHSKGCSTRVWRGRGSPTEAPEAQASAPRSPIAEWRLAAGSP